MNKKFRVGYWSYDYSNGYAVRYDNSGKKLNYYATPESFDTMEEAIEFAKTKIGGSGYTWEIIEHKAIVKPKYEANIEYYK